MSLAIVPFGFLNPRRKRRKTTKRRRATKRYDNPRRARRVSFRTHDGRHVSFGTSGRRKRRYANSRRVIGHGSGYTLERIGISEHRVPSGSRRRDSRGRLMGGRFDRRGVATRVSVEAKRRTKGTRHRDKWGHRAGGQYRNPTRRDMANYAKWGPRDRKGKLLPMSRAHGHRGRMHDNASYANESYDNPRRRRRSSRRRSPAMYDNPRRRSSRGHPRNADGTFRRKHANPAPRPHRRRR